MESKWIFGGTISLLEKVLDLRSLRHNLIASNIANVDTPNYKALDLDFKKELAKSMGTQKGNGLKRTQPAHLPGNGGGLNNVKQRLVATSPLNIKGDGNSVDIDKVMASQAENSLMYNVSAQILAKKFLGLKNVIQGGNK